jgi:hypothetical protein
MTVIIGENIRNYKTSRGEDKRSEDLGPYKSQLHIEGSIALLRKHQVHLHKLKFKSLDIESSKAAIKS